MLIEIENTSIENIQSILKFMAELNLKVTFIDDAPSGSFEKKYTGEELNELIRNARMGDTIGVNEAHERIRTLFKWK